MLLKITKRNIDSIQSQDHDQFIWDTELKGFGLKVTKTSQKNGLKVAKGGQKIYVLQYRMGGRATPVKRLTIGKHGSPWTPEDARLKAKEYLRQVEDGVDPVAWRNAVPKEAPQDGMPDVLADFIERHCRPRGRSFKERNRTINHDVLPTWKEKRVGEIVRADVIALLDDILERSALTQANYTFRLLRTFFNWCIQRGWLQASPMSGMKSPAPNRERDRWLTYRRLCGARGQA